MVSQKRAAKSQRWTERQKRDPFVQQAQRDGYRGRAAYKLQQIDEKYRLIKPTSRLADLGAAPGSWCQYCVRKPAFKGQIFALDVLPMKEIDGVDFILGDITDPIIVEQLLEQLGGQRLDIVLSDMAPNLTGIRDRDAAQAERIQEAVLGFADAALRPGGQLLTKLFEGGDIAGMRRAFGDKFDKIINIKPAASRAQSKEVYLLARGFRANTCNPVK